MLGVLSFADTTLNRILVMGAVEQCKFKGQLEPTLLAFVPCS